MANLVAPGDPVAVASAGKFGERWLELCEAYGGEATHLDVEWGEAIAPERLERDDRGACRSRRRPCSSPSRRPRPGS